ncbi:hypothetical protein [Lysinibacillus sp. NPDC096212]|uniref:hypothetical protein n=1 Tax=Lysinibacillus sp. NPDC096212 TaxID=3364135 RepID=UPI003823AA09
MEQKGMDEKSYNYIFESNKRKENVLLERVSMQYDVNVEIVNRLMNLEMSMWGKIKRRGLQNQIDAMIQSSILSKGEEV